MLTRDDILKKLRKMKSRMPRKTWQEVSEEIGEQPAYLSAMVNGYRKPSMKVLSYFGLEPEKTLYRRTDGR